jgi:N utilization substance protein B
MASNRHLGRIVALQTLYEQDFRAECGDLNLNITDILDRNIERYSETIDDKDFIVSLVQGVFSKSSE